MQGAYSNTSHVIVYLQDPGPARSPNHIQIHLMLLFIFASLLYAHDLITIQIHLMLLFIFAGYGEERSNSKIQIHLMLLFIRS